MHIINLLPKMVLLSSLLLSQVAFAQEQQVHTADQSMTESEDHQTDHSKMQHQMQHMDHANIQQMTMPVSSKEPSAQKQSRDTQKKQANTEQQGDQHAQH
jgi:uncharacterized protein YjaZ